MRVFRKVASTSVLAVVLLFLMGVAVLAHEERTPVIIDTDMAMDDVRALALMLSSPHVDVKAIVTSDGASSPEAGSMNIRRVLSFLGIKDIPVAAGRSPDAPPPPWREMSEALGWARLPDSGEAQRGRLVGRNGVDSLKAAVPVKGAQSDAASLILKTLDRSQPAVSYICIGPMTNLAEAFRADSAAGSRISAIYYYGASPEEPKPGWNTERDSEAARAVFSSGVPLYAIYPREEELLVLDSNLLEEIKRIDSPAAQLVSRLHEGERMKKLLMEKHFKSWDETVALYMDNPRLGSFEKAAAEPPFFRLSKWEKEAARSDYIGILSRRPTQELDPRVAVVLEAYPSHPAQFQEDLRPFVPRIIALHGIEEWKAAVLTNELHRHLGIYSILGAKMGILAREILSASLDELSVESHAGLKPPFSCLNDGLQVSTGASLGRGTIRIPENDSPAVEAVFAKGDRKLQLRLTDSVKRRIRSDIQSTIQRYGDLSPEYFKEIRRLSFEYWAGMKREEIFEREVNTP